MINTFFLLMILAELLAATSQILLKMSAQKEHSSFIREYLNLPVIAGYGLLMLSMVIAIFCYNDLGYMGVVVMEPLAFIMVMFLARLVFKEKITLKKLAGMLLIIAGIVVFYAV